VVWQASGEHQGPSSVIAIVCSEWAVREPSAERMVQPSGSKTIRSVVRTNQGSSARVMPGRSLRPRPASATQPSIPTARSMLRMFPSRSAWSVEHHVVDRRADDVAERAVAEGRGVVPMVRNPLTPEQIEAGWRLGRLLRKARADRDLDDVAHAAGMSLVLRLPTSAAPIDGEALRPLLNSSRSTCRSRAIRPAR
jgi:hypothetical protein